MCSKEWKMETVFAMLKPLGAQEPLRSEILSMIETVAHVVLSKRCVVRREEIEELYWRSGHDKEGEVLPHFHAIVNYLTGKEVELLIITGVGALQKVDNLIGGWKPEEAQLGTIRHLAVGLDYIVSVDTPVGSNKYCYDNLIHSSDTLEQSSHDLLIWFTEEEIAEMRI